MEADAAQLAFLLYLRRLFNAYDPTGLILADVVEIITSGHEWPEIAEGVAPELLSEEVVKTWFPEYAPIAPLLAKAVRVAVKSLEADGISPALAYSIVIAVGIMLWAFTRTSQP